MHRKSIKLLAFFLLLAPLFLTGCSDEMFYPEATYVISSIEPFDIIPTAADTVEDLGETVITIVAKNGVASSIKSYSIRYYTNLGDEITAAATGEITYNLVIPPAEEDADGEEVEMTLYPYSMKIANIFATTESDITPIRAEIKITCEDVNGNHPTLETSCLLHKYVETDTETTE